MLLVVLSVRKLLMGGLLQAHISYGIQIKQESPESKAVKLANKLFGLRGQNESEAVTAQTNFWKILALLK